MVRFIAGGVAGVALIVLLACATSSASSEAQIPDAYEAGWKGEKVCEILDEDEAIRVLKCTFPPGVGHETHIHPPHFGYILAGGTMQLEDVDGVRVRTLKTGGSWVRSEPVLHSALNVGEETQQYLIVEKKYVR